ncbi:hypothetical protein SGRI78S_06751 [Streptomyces griseus subsp. griseus]
MVPVTAAPPRPVRERAGRRPSRQPLPYQPGLADARLPGDPQQPGPAAADGSLQSGVERTPFGVAADEGDVEAAQQLGVVRAQRQQPVGLHAVPLALQPQRPGGFGPHRRARGEQGLRADQDLAGARVLLQPGGDVDGLPGDQGLPGGRVRTRHHLPGVDADPGGQLDAQSGVQLLVQPGQRPTHPERRRQRPAGVVVTDHRYAEHRHHRVPDELLRGAAPRHDLRAHRLEVAQGHRAQGLGVEHPRQRGGPDEVAEQHGHRLAFVTGRRGGDRPGPGGPGGRARGPAGRTEPGRRRQILLARGAVHGGSFSPGGRAVGGAVRSGVRACGGVACGQAPVRGRGACGRTVCGEGPGGRTGRPCPGGYGPGGPEPAAGAVPVIGHRPPVRTGRRRRSRRAPGPPAPRRPAGP